jgi:hypothetical protein
MHQDDNEYIEILPETNNTKCKIIYYAIYILISYSWLIFAVIFWYKYNISFALLSIPVVYIITGIVISKMKLESIPFNEHESSHSNLEIAKWYTLKVIC